MIVNQKERENMETKEILHKRPSKRSFRNGIHSLQRRADARGSADIIAAYVTHFAGQASLLTSKSRSRIEYLTPTDNILWLGFDTLLRRINLNFNTI